MTGVFYRAKNQTDVQNYSAQGGNPLNKNDFLIFIFETLSDNKVKAIRRGDNFL